MKFPHCPWWCRLAARREPDFVIGDKDNPSMKRWWLIPRNHWFNVYLHRFLRSDDDRALHDHPYVNMSVLLQGEYREHTIAAGGVHHFKTYRSGSVKFRWPSSAHRIEVEAPCWTLFVTGPRVREWGFHCPGGWRSWKVFTDARDYGKTGRGCGD